MVNDPVVLDFFVTDTEILCRGDEVLALPKKIVHPGLSKGVARNRE